MSRRPAPKRIQYVRATYNKGTAPKDSLEFLIRSACRKLGAMKNTQVSMGLLGTVAIRQRNVNTPILLALGAGAKHEHMSTLGFDVTAVQDDDLPEAPPANRAFKHADAYVLLEENDLLIVVDGGFTTSTVATYLKELLRKANPAKAISVFELRPVSNRDKAAVLAREGIKEIEVKSSMYAATQLQANTSVEPGSALACLAGTLRSFIEESQSEEQMELLAEEWADLQVTTVISAKGGSRAKEAVLDSIELLGEELVREAPSDMKLTIKTRQNTVITSDQLVRVKSANLKRRTNTNDLDVSEVWEQLGKYREQLRSIGEWLR